MSTVVQRPALGSRIIVCVAMCLMTLAAFAQRNKVFINEQWPIRGKTGSLLSPPHVELTNECSQSVYVDSIVPKSTLIVRLNGATVIGGPVISQFGFDSIPLTVQLHVGDKIITPRSRSMGSPAHPRHR